MYARTLPRFFVIAFPILFAVLHVNSQTCPQVAGCLDSTFGIDGKVLSQLYPNDPATVQKMAVHSDGKIVAFAGNFGGSVKLFRLKADGSFDPDFGSGGIVNVQWTVTTSSGTRYDGIVKSLAIQNVGGQERIVIAGNDWVPSGRSMLGALRLNRYLPDGTLDTSFGTNGKVAFGGSAGEVEIQPADQKIVTTGDISGLVRFNVDGTLDGTFGTGGKISLPQGYFTGIAFDASGGILISGRETSGKGKSATQQMTVRRYRPNGTLDTLFGASGVASAYFGYSAAGNDVAVDGLGNIVVIGFARAVVDAGSANFGVARFTATGQPDLSFAGTGKLVYDFGGHDDIPSNVLIQAMSGKIIVTGQVWPTTVEAREFGAIRLNYDGSVDATFGTGGRMVANVYGVDNSRSSALQIDPLCSCEKLVMSGGDSPYTTFARFTALP